MDELLLPYPEREAGVYEEGSLEFVTDSVLVLLLLYDGLVVIRGLL